MNQFFNKFLSRIDGDWLIKIEAKYIFNLGYFSSYFMQNYLKILLKKLNHSS